MLPIFTTYTVHTYTRTLSTHSSDRLNCQLQFIQKLDPNQSTHRATLSPPPTDHTVTLQYNTNRPHCYTMVRTTLLIRAVVLSVTRISSLHQPTIHSAATQH